MENCVQLASLCRIHGSILLEKVKHGCFGGLQDERICFMKHIAWKVTFKYIFWTPCSRRAPPGGALPWNTYNTPCFSCFFMAESIFFVAFSCHWKAYHLAPGTVWKFTPLLQVSVVVGHREITRQALWMIWHLNKFLFTVTAVREQDFLTVRK